MRSPPKQLRRSRADQLDLLFRALADRTRRALLARLARKPAMVTELAAPFDLSLPAVSRHIKVLEHAGLVRRTVDGRVQSYEGGFHPLAVPPDLHRHVIELAKRESATPFMVLLAAFAGLLSRWCGQVDVVVGSPVGLF